MVPMLALALSVSLVAGGPVSSSRPDLTLRVDPARSHYDAAVRDLRLDADDDARHERRARGRKALLIGGGVLAYGTAAFVWARAHADTGPHQTELAVAGEAWIIGTVLVGAGVWFLVTDPPLPRASDEGE